MVLDSNVAESDVMTVDWDEEVDAPIICRCEKAIGCWGVNAETDAASE